jgi:hypothetical protein
MQPQIALVLTDPNGQISFCLPGGEEKRETERGWRIKAKMV